MKDKEYYDAITLALDEYEAAKKQQELCKLKTKDAKRKYDEAIEEEEKAKERVASGVEQLLKLGVL